MTIFDHLIVFMFAVLYPACDFFFSSPQFKINVSNNKPNVRIREYQKGIAWIWILSTLALVVWISHDRALSNIGLDFHSVWQTLLGFMLLISALIYMRTIHRTIKNDAKQRSAMNIKLNDSSASIYLPRTKNDFVWFVMVSMSAGICEELLFRGYLMWYINEFSSMVLAIIISSLLFGLAHSYQGWKGVIQSGVSGLVLAGIYVLTGSLWIPIALHIVGDAYSGMLGWLAFDETSQEQNTANNSI